MKLVKVQIRQFRSIAEMDVSFRKNCLVLLGINESGKTNILEAMALLSSGQGVSPSDKRQPASEEPIGQESFVRFVFDLQDDERQLIEDKCLAALCGDPEKLGLSLGSKDASMRDVVDVAARQGLYQIDVDDGQKYPSTWRVDDEIAIAEGWLVPKENCPDGVQVDHPRDGRVAAKQFVLVSRSSVPEEKYLDWFEEANGKELLSSVQNQARKLVRERLPECVYWSYLHDDALPQSVPWKEFLDNPAAYPVVQNMFRLAGHNRPRKDVDAASKTPTGVRRLLERVGTLVTKRLRQTWDDFDELSIELYENGPNLECVVRDVEGAYSFAQRSDGFRRFVSFLLMVSCRDTAGTFSGGLLLYDEPDTSLHPSGARQLRDELLRLSANNTVVYSTHSIFMVDPDNLERHLLVTKRDEKTEAKVAAPGTLRDEEVLYQAVGHTVYDVLKRRNVILEGWRDKKLIECAMPLAELAVQDFFGDVGLCHARGVKRVPNVAPMVEMLGRPYLVLSDSDDVAVKTRRDEDSRWPWKLYSELTEARFVTAEDFIKEDSLQKFVASALDELPELESLSLRFDQPFLAMLMTALAKKGTAKPTAKETVSALKERIFEQLESSDLRPEVVDLLKGVQEELLRQGTS